MKNKRFAFAAMVSAVIAVANLIAAYIGIHRLPETIPLHFNAQWICDGMGSRWILLIFAVLPVIAAAVGVIFLTTGKAEYSKITAITVLLTESYLIGAFWMIYSTVNSGVKIGEPIDSQLIVTLLPLMLSAMFIIIGNYLPIIQPNKTFGLRVPWTIRNPQCWRRTHRFAGKFWVVTGLLMCIIALTALALHHAGEVWVMPVMTGIILINVVVPCMYAYQHRNDKSNN